MEKQPTVILMANDRKSCNNRCSHCYLQFEGNRDPRELLGLTEELRKKYRVIIAGSETLTNPEYLKSYKSAGQRHILTNGILLSENPALYNELRTNGIEEIQISLHFGVETTLGSVPRGLVERVIERAKREMFRVQIKTTIIQENIDDIEKMCKEAEGMGVDCIEFLKYVKSGRARSEERDRLTTEQIKKFFMLVDDVRKQYSKDVLEIKIHGNFGPKDNSLGAELTKRGEYCPAGLYSYAITPDNKIYGCPLLMDSPIGELSSNIQLQITSQLQGLRDKCLAEN